MLDPGRLMTLIQIDKKRTCWDEKLESLLSKGTLTWASSWITRYCSFQTVILETSSFLRARSFFNSGLQKVLIEFMEELSLLSLTSTSRRSISFSRRIWESRIKKRKYCNCGLSNSATQPLVKHVQIKLAKIGEKFAKYLFELCLQVQYGVVSGLP